MKILNGCQKKKYCQAPDIIDAEVRIGVHGMEIWDKESFGARLMQNQACDTCANHQEDIIEEN